jgi:hypothetical protein
MATCNPVTVLQDVDCLLCLSDKQLGVAILRILCQIQQTLDPMATCNVEDLIADSSDYLAMTDKQIRAAQLEMLCQLVAAPGALGGVVIDTVDPAADPGVESQIWINRTSGQVWYWNDTTGAWVLLIA